MRTAIAACCVVMMLPVCARALIFSDDFEAGVRGTVWTPWPPANPMGINNLLTTDSGVNHTPGSSKSARAWEADPAAWNGYSDFSATSGSIRAVLYVYENVTHNGTNPAQPVANNLALFGNHPSGPQGFSDYLQLGVVPYYPGGSWTYGFRTLYDDTLGGGFHATDTGVLRKAGWTKLTIEADSLASGGAVRFFIDDLLAGASFRAGANGGAGGLSPVDLRWVRIGINNKSYENFWYDDLSVISTNGDFSGDGRVDAADYIAWRKSAASQDVYETWRSNFGLVATASNGTMAASVPEPSSLLPLAAMLAAVANRRKREIRRQPTQYRKKFRTISRGAGGAVVDSAVRERQNNRFGYLKLL